MKWNFVRRRQLPQVSLCEPDEGEPGTFKDREIPPAQPAHAVGDDHRLLRHRLPSDLVYCRGEFRKTAMARLQTAIARRASRLHRQEHPRLGIRPRGAYGVRRGRVHLRRRDRMLESLEGKKGYPA